MFEDWWSFANPWRDPCVEQQTEAQSLAMDVRLTAIHTLFAALCVVRELVLVSLHMIQGLCMIFVMQPRGVRTSMSSWCASALLEDIVSITKPHNC